MVLESGRDLRERPVLGYKRPLTSGGGGGQGGGRPGEKGAGGVREAGEEGAGSGRKGEKLRNIAQYFAIEKMQRGGSQKMQGGNRD